MSQTQPSGDSVPIDRVVMWGYLVTAEHSKHFPEASSAVRTLPRAQGSQKPSEVTPLPPGHGDGGTMGGGKGAGDVGGRSGGGVLGGLEGGREGGGEEGSW